MRTLYDKNSFIRVVRELKKIRRDFDTVNQRCQQDLQRLGFYYLEFINPQFGSEVREHAITLVNTREYGTMLIYGMSPQAIGHGMKVRLYGICVDIPDFYRAKTEEEIKAEKALEEEAKAKAKKTLDEIKSKSMFDFNDEVYIPTSTGRLTTKKTTKKKSSRMYGSSTLTGNIFIGDPVYREAPRPENDRGEEQPENENRVQPDEPANEHPTDFFDNL